MDATEKAVGGGRVGATLALQVSEPLTTVHLPPERAVLTTPAMIGLMERCIALAEEAEGWQSASAEIRHRAGLRRGETVAVQAELVAIDGDDRRWAVQASTADGRLIGEGEIVRRRLPSSTTG